MKAGYIETPITKPSQVSIKKQVKREKERDINRMGSLAIIGHLLYRHRVGILATTNILFVLYLTGILGFIAMFARSL
jgi:hypothetical protein